MSYKEFSGILRNTFLKFGIPAIVSITLVPVLAIISESPIILKTVILTTLMSLGYVAATVSRKVVVADLVPSDRRYRVFALDIDRRSRLSAVLFNRSGKRVFDIVAATGMIIVFLPALALIGLALLVQGRPVLIRHRRIGRGGELFPCLKFRTMVMNGDEILRHHLALNPSVQAEWSRHHRLEKDPRVTMLGRLLRKSSLDELPQLFNVLRGEMSVVGPRPIMPVEAVYYGEYLRRYEAVRPGLTGAWQLSIHNNVNLHATYEDRVAADIKYMAEFSLKNDIKILLMTVPAVLRNKVEISSEKTDSGDLFPTLELR